MKARTTLLLLASAVFAAGNAQLQEAHRVVKSKALVQNESVQQLKPIVQQKAQSPKLKLSAPVLKMRTAETAAEAVITEDFSGFTTGSVGAPDLETVIFEQTGQVQDGYFQTPGWLAIDIYPAGGAAYLKAESILRTPALDLTDNGGAFRVTFRAKAATTTPTEVMVINIASGASGYSSDASASLTTEWQEFSLMLAQGSNADVVQFQGATADFYIDDFRVACEGPQPPVALPCTGFNGTSATAHWEAVENAESYNLKLYYASEATGYYYEVYDEIKGITGTSYLIEGLDPNIYYAYEVRAKVGEDITGASNFIEIESGVVAPTALPCTNYDGTSADAHWEEVPGAEYYHLTLYFGNMETGNYEIDKQFNNIQTTSYHLTDLDPDTQYAYTVTCQIGEEVSEESNLVKLMSNLPAPVVLPCTNFTGTSFTANWEPVEGAVSYGVMLYTDDSQYLIPLWDEVAVTTETSYEITGIELGMPYHYTVCAIDDKGMFSEESDYVTAAPDKVDTPIVLPATNITKTGFTANWEAVALGDSYLVTLYKEIIATADRPLELINTDFSGVESEGTIDNPEFTMAPYFFDDVAGVGGWYISIAALADGAVGIDNSLAFLFGPSFLLSPEFDFAKYGGKATVKVKWAGVQGAASALVAFATADEEGLLSFPQDGTTYPLTETMTEQVIELEGGPDNGYIIIICPENAGFLMIDELQASIELESGDKVMLNLKEATTTETKYEYTGLTQGEGERFAYNVMAAYTSGSDAVISELSELVYVDLNAGSGIEETSDVKAKVYVNGNELCIVNPERQAVEVYNANGSLLINDRAAAETAVYELPMAGVYLVKVGNETFKVIK